MKKSFLILLCFGFLIALAPLSLAANLQVQKTDRGSVVLSEINNPAIFNFTIINNGANDTFQIYTLLGVSMTPIGTFDLSTGTTEIEVRAYPNRDLRKQIGALIFDYQIKGQASGIFNDKLTIDIVNLRGAVEIKGSNINVGDGEVKITVKNLQNTNIDDLTMAFSSALFDGSAKISLKPYQEVSIPVMIDKDKIKKLAAGNYVISAVADPENAKVKLEGTVKYLEGTGVSVDETSSGFIIRKTAITKTNEGNVPTAAKIEISKDIISRLFSTYSSEPASTSRSGLVINYDWNKNLAPGESFVVTSTTNYTLPFVLLVLIVLITIMVRVYTQTIVVLQKRVSFVRTKGGEFALRVKLHVKAKRHIDNLQIIDRFPGSVSLYEKFGVMPDKVDKAARRLFWNIDRLNAGEERVFSYLVFSKIKIIGRFELPPATGIFDKNGKTHEIYSNRAFFVAETARSE